MQHWTIFSAALRKNRENIGVTAAAAAQKGQEKMARDEVLLPRRVMTNLVAEHEELVAVRRLEVAERLKEAISYGDLSENAEYDAAKNEQAELEEKILKLETMIRNAKVIDESEITSDRVNLGHTVRVEYIGAGEVEEYTIVGSNESDPFEGRISNESAEFGSALIGTSVNDEVTVEIPDGIIHLKVLEISRH